MKMQKECNFTLFDWVTSWSTECRLTQREISTSFLLDVATLRRWNVATKLNIYISEDKIRIEQLHLGPEYNHK